MLVAVLALAAFVVAVEPALVAFHEFGHAIVPIALGKETAVFVGGDSGPTTAIGPLSISVAPSGFLRPVTRGATVTDVQSSRWTVLAGTLGGPLTSLLVTIGAVGSLQYVASAFQWWLAVFAICYVTLQTLSTLVPLRGPPDPESGDRFRTDGRIALELLLGRDPVLDGDECSPGDDR